MEGLMSSKGQQQLLFPGGGLRWRVSTGSASDGGAAEGDGAKVLASSHDCDLNEVEGLIGDHLRLSSSLNGSLTGSFDEAYAALGLQTVPQPQVGEGDGAAASPAGDGWVPPPRYTPTGTTTTTTTTSPATAKLPASAAPTAARTFTSEVRGLVREHSGKIPLSVLGSLLSDAEDNDDRASSGGRDDGGTDSDGGDSDWDLAESAGSSGDSSAECLGSSGSRGGDGFSATIVTSVDTSPRELSDLDVAAAAAAAAAAAMAAKSAKVKGGGLSHKAVAAAAAAATDRAKAAAATAATAAEAAAATAAKSAARAARQAARREARRAARRAGGGAESDAVRRARQLFAVGHISEAELATLVAKDAQFCVEMDAAQAEDERFCVSRAFGESWAAKKVRVRAESPLGGIEGWDLVGLIAKSNDDLRQEVCALQLIELSKRIFERAKLPLFLRAYRILSTDASTGVIEVLTDAISIDALKKRQLQRINEAQTTAAAAAAAAASSSSSSLSSLGDAPPTVAPAVVPDSGLAAHFEATYGPADTPRGHAARWRFASSLAAYSAVCYAFAIKDRHNGNILLDTAGHLIHIDFGFLLGIAPGGGWSIETAPFKLTDEFVAVLGDVHSKLFAEFVLLFACAILALQQGFNQIASVLEIMCDQSPFPCFAGTTAAEVLARLRARLRPGADKRAVVGLAVDLVKASMGSTLTRQYDNFQWLTNGIMP